MQQAHAQGALRSDSVRATSSCVAGTASSIVTLDEPIAVAMASKTIVITTSSWGISRAVRLGLLAEGLTLLLKEKPAMLLI